MLLLLTKATDGYICTSFSLQDGKVLACQASGEKVAEKRVDMLHLPQA
jgi:hypothetical protein